MKELLASIDIGAHSARLLIVQFSKSGKYETIEDLEIPVPLGADVFRTGRISPASVRVLCTIMKNFRKKLSEYKIEKYRAIATSAVREAENAEVFLDRIAFLTGIRIQIFSGGDEARLGWYAIRATIPSAFRFKEKNILSVDIGTGACQVSAYERGTLRFTETVRLGTLRAADALSDTASADRRIEALRPMIESAFGDMAYLSNKLDSEYLIVTGASSRAMISMMKKTSGHKPVRLTLNAFQELYKISAESTVETLCEKYHLRPDIAEAVLPCCMMIETLCRLTGASTIIVPRVSTKHALIEDFINESAQRIDPFEEQTLGLAALTARRYGCDTIQSANTAHFAEELFTKLLPLHGMTHRDLLLLKVAALLHKSGLFISNHGYHKHSYYIILNTEIPGLSLNERKIAALLVLYHRRALPALSDPDYASMLPEDRARINKLAGILRLACGLTLSRTPGARITVKMETDHITIQIAGASSMRIGNAVDTSLFNYAFATKLVFA